MKFVNPLSVARMPNHPEIMTKTLTQTADADSKKMRANDGSGADVISPMSGLPNDQKSAWKIRTRNIAMILSSSKLDNRAACGVWRVAGEVTSEYLYGECVCRGAVDSQLFVTPIMPVINPTSDIISRMVAITRLIIHMERTLKWPRTLSTKYVTPNHHMTAPMAIQK